MFGVNDFSKSLIDFSNFHISQLGDAFLFGGAIVLIGIATVFAVLCLLWLCLVLFKIFFHDLPAKKSAQATSAPAPVEAAPVVAATPTEGEIVAVIAAAIAMAESENSGLKFKVVSFKRV